MLLKISILQVFKNQRRLTINWYPGIPFNEILCNIQTFNLSTKCTTKCNLQTGSLFVEATTSVLPARQCEWKFGQASGKQAWASGILYRLPVYKRLPGSGEYQKILISQPEHEAGQYHCCWCPGPLHHHVTSSNGIVLFHSDFPPSGEQHKQCIY